MRTDLQFDEAHIPGSVCIPMLNAGFGSKLAWVADREQDIVLVGRDDADGRAAGRLAVAIGLRRLTGFLGGGMTSWRQERRPTDLTERITVRELADRIAAGDAPQLLDVRDRREWEEGHVPGSTLTTWHDVTSLPAGLDRCAADRGRLRVRAARRDRRKPRAPPRRAGRSCMSSTAACPSSGASAWSS